ncbi:hypothetical protein SPI_02250 [Niveomyces insectorum RCEF 264]|uniref:Uncharacterized protein n=1 Tax=Niveomyces insectorum RCEF 264 TaxID=1081102 RepID=A0A167XVN9_9HYPO|nr:hypothetical protein SPI_02250 [Niveomyces insectorum RCEF 264]
MAAMEARMGSMGALAQPYPSLPASPTLTNPDMILPDYDLSSSPSLDDEDRQARSQSPLMMWKNTHAAASGTDLQQLFSGVQNHHTFPSVPITPTTPIIYGNGTMLSDIGEVTEVESTPGRPSPGSIRRRNAGSTDGGGAPGGAFAASSSGSRTPSPTPIPHNLRHPFHYGHKLNSREAILDAPRRSSPTIGVEEGGSSGGGGSGVGVKQRARQQQQQQQQTSQDRIRRDSIDSNSTITTQDQANLFADFDDAVSVGDSVFQGDDEESVAESYVEEPYVAREVPITSTAASSALLTVPEFGGGSGSGNTSDEGERRLSAATLSLRAEHILANAKRRLTTMEGNLNRARSSLYIASPTGGSLPSEGSTPSPKTPVRSATAFATSRHQERSSSGSPAQTRLAGDGSASTDSTPTSQLFPQRSASALGAAGGYRQTQLTSFKSAEQMRNSLAGGLHRSGYNKAVDIILEPLNEDETIDEPLMGPSFHQNRTSAQLDPFLSPAPGGPNEKGLTRSASVAQMRDLKDQMKDLKGKISSLREQARADSMKRRSLQSLRTPSPFTHSQVDQWYAEPEPQIPGPQSSGKGSSGRNPWNGELESVDGEQGHGVGTAGTAAADQDLATPSPPSEHATGSARLSGSTSSRSSSAVRDNYNTRLIENDDEQTDESLVDGAYDENAAVECDYSSSGQLKQSHELREAEDAASDFTADDEDDDMRTENGDFSDGDAVRRTAEVAIGNATHEEERERDDTDGAYAVDDGEIASPVQPEAQLEDDDGDYESESGESLYHDTLQHPVSHEDREDAFDYEHFILHSALGTISQQRLAARGRSDSFSSESSVETTRGPVAASKNDDDVVLSPNRRASMNSISTVDSFESFATATEGRTSRNKRLSSDSDEPSEDRSPRNTTRDRPDSALTAKQPFSSKEAPFPSNGGSSRSKRNSVEEPRQTQLPTMMRRPASSAAIPGHRPSVSSFESTGTTRSFPLINRNKMNSLGAAAAAAVSALTGVGSPGSAMHGNGGSNGGSNSGSNSSSGGSAASSLTGLTSAPALNRSSYGNEELRSISETLMNETASVCEQAAEAGTSDPQRKSLDSQRSQSSLQWHERAGSSASVGGPGAQAHALQQLSKEDQYLVERLVGNLGRCVLGLSETGRASTESRNFRRRIDAARRILEGLDPV